MNRNNFIQFPIRTDHRLITRLYEESDKQGKPMKGLKSLSPKFDPIVASLTDKILVEYLDTHFDDKVLTTYIGFSSTYRYNVQIKESTLDRIAELATRFGTKNGQIIKAALYIWELQLRG